MRSDNFTWYLQTHFMAPLLLHRGGLCFPHGACISHQCKRQCDDLFLSLVRKSSSHRRALHPMCYGSAWTVHPPSCLLADSRAPWDGACAAQLSQTQGQFLQTTHTGGVTATGRNRGPYCILNTEFFLHIKNDHSV